MRVATATALLLVILLIAGLPGLTGLAPRLENNPWGVTTYDFRYAIDVGNFGTTAARNMTLRVALLRDFTPFQQVLSQSVDIPGATIEEDELSNRYAVYAFPELAPGASVMANVTARARIFSIDFSVGPGTFPAPSPGPQYTVPEPFVESTDMRIANQSARLWENSSSATDFVYRSYAWTTQHLTFETQPQERGAVWALKTGRGMCYEYSNLYMSLLRARGIAAKRVNGWGTPFQAHEVHHVEAIAHAWVLLYTADHGWTPVDPTFVDVHLFENFMKINDMHVILTEGVNRHLYRVTFDRVPGTNVQVDYTVHVLAKQEQNLSAARQVVWVGVLSVPILAAVIIIVQVGRERRRRASGEVPSPPPT